MDIRAVTYHHTQGALKLEQRRQVGLYRCSGIEIGRLLKGASTCWLTVAAPAPPPDTRFSGALVFSGRDVHQGVTRAGPIQPLLVGPHLDHPLSTCIQRTSRLVKQQDLRDTAGRQDRQRLLQSRAVGNAPSLLSILYPSLHHKKG
jgi:hypothetical protein